jgi:CBS domain-containing protein
MITVRQLLTKKDQTISSIHPSDKRVRHLPVLEGKKVIGIVSIGDLVKSIISDQKFIIEQFEHYIQR